MASQNPPQKRLSVSEKIANNPTKRPHLSLSEKYEVVKKVEATGNKSSVARDFNLKPQSVDYIMSQASKIKEKYEENPVVAKYRKSFTGAEVGLELDKLLYEWLVNVRSANKNIDTALLLKTGVNTFIRILMLPKNTTSKLQPCGQGCIRSLKGLTGLVMHNEAKDVSLYEGLLMLRAAWTMDF